MRLLALTACAMSQLTGCATYQVEPGEVVVRRLAKSAQVTATFALRSDPDGDGPTRLTTGGTRDGVTGGACLIFRGADDPKACSAHADCAESTSTGYCLNHEPLQGIAEDSVTEKVCWYKNESYCIKSPLAVLTLDNVVQLPEVDAFPSGRNRPMLWRVVSCQNLTDTDCGRPDAQEGINRRTRFGPVTRVD